MRTICAKCKRGFDYVPNKKPRIYCSDCSPYITKNAIKKIVEEKEEEFDMKKVFAWEEICEFI